MSLYGHLFLTRNGNPNRLQTISGESSFTSVDPS